MNKPQVVYAQGRLAGRQTCENMVLDRATESKKISLTKEEIWEELLQ